MPLTKVVDVLQKKTSDYFYIVLTVDSDTDGTVKNGIKLKLH